MTLAEAIRDVLNKQGRDCQSNTPDYILANYLEACLVAFENAIQQREYYHGRDPRSTVPKPRRTATGLGGITHNIGDLVVIPRRDDGSV